MGDNKDKRFQTPLWNIPVVTVDGYYVDGDNEEVTFYPQNGRTDSINAPFEGVFLLKVFCDVKDNPRYIDTLTYKIKVGSIYGGNRILYDKENGAVTVSKWSGIGCYLCHYDTDDKQLYLVG